MVTIVGQTTIDDGSTRFQGLDPAAGEVSRRRRSFAAPRVAGPARRVALPRRRHADLVADPNTPVAVRENASIVLENNLLAISPDETTAIAFVAPILATGQFDNLAGRVPSCELADPGGTVSAGGLTFVTQWIAVLAGAASARR